MIKSNDQLFYSLQELSLELGGCVSACSLLRLAALALGLFTAPFNILNLPNNIVVSSSIQA